MKYNFQNENRFLKYYRRFTTLPPSFLPSLPPSLPAQKYPRDPKIRQRTLLPFLSPSLLLLPVQIPQIPQASLPPFLPLAHWAVALLPHLQALFPVHIVDLQGGEGGQEKKRGELKRETFYLVKSLWLSSAPRMAKCRRSKIAMRASLRCLLATFPPFIPPSCLPSPSSSPDPRALQTPAIYLEICFEPALDCPGSCRGAI